MAQDKVQKYSAYVKIGALIIFAAAIGSTLMQKPKLSPEIEKNTINIRFKTYGGQKADRAWGLAGDNDDIIIYGDTNSFGAGARDMYLLKTDKDGGLIYTRTFGGPGNESLMKTLVLKDGYLLVGGTDSFGNGGTDGYVVKVNKDGEKEWEMTRGGENYDYFYGAAEVDDGYILCGYSSSFGSGNNSDAYIVKINKRGELRWYKTYGGPKWDILYSVAVVDDGLVFTGYTDSEGAGLTDILLLKTDFKGNKIWSKTFGAERQDMGSSLITTKDRGFIIAAKSTSYVAKGFGWDGLILKVDAKGNSLWSRVIPAAEFDPGCVITEDNGKIYVAGIKKCYGICDMNAYFGIVDPDGNTVQERYLSAARDDMASGVIKFNDSFYIAGTTMSYGKGFGDIFLTRLGADLKEIW